MGFELYKSGKGRTEQPTGSAKRAVDAATELSAD
jgi:hypothetical protein